ncbi:NAD(P)-dependent dehydrogenase, short-chain alcohol dehydrogenase family [Robiginitalea myxolifaciens]|uniref:NAD(P)-dependent dehydrogenase, short-chain alcohol dehydrogenase family n=1 Tax=Robiginitalea myxolifaciens TaxID=400055 RepID=A0A1I6GZ20_9FLAO|nr:SDR family oxidoreductase [Robiginitalea myxolifaciens]SFR47311.1 NAD(P)-dependent dehydrogenase, short-chain alcohol dehydrogenase family [Robiginitalea myxolifaciens]
MNGQKKPHVLILGGSKGLGWGCVEKFCREGYPVLAIHRDRRSDLDGITAKATALQANGTALEMYQMDAFKAASRESFIQGLPDTVKESGIGVIVFSIARGNLGKMDSLSSADLRITSEAMAFVLQDWVVALLEAGCLASDCRIIAFTSEGSSRVMPGYGPVAVAKAALEAMIRQMAVELAPRGIRANCVQAGVTDTESLRMIPGAEKLMEYAKKRNPNKRLTLPEDVANATYLLSLPEAAWITGNVIAVDGGESLS